VRRSLVALTAAAATAATMSAVHAAAPPADTGRVAETQLTVPLGHGTVLSLELRAATLSGGDVLRVVASRCDADGSCDELTPYQSAIPASALSIDPNTATATLTTTISGRHLLLKWRPQTGTDQGETVGGDLEVDNANNTSTDEYQGDGAVVTVDVDGVVCTTGGGVGESVFADSSTVTGESGVQELSALQLPDAASITCS